MKCSIFQQASVQGLSKSGSMQARSTHRYVWKRRLAPLSPSCAAATPPGGQGVVITGGSKGLGFAMAAEFLQAGDSVVICSRDAARLEAALAALCQRSNGSSSSIHGLVCDVSSPADMECLGRFAVDKLVRVHHWINNAGAVTENRLLADVSPEEISQAVGTNVLGSLLGSREAVRIMRQQPASVQPCYHIWNLGFSAWGAKFSRSAATHKATKMALKQLSESLAEELRDAGLTSIAVHNLSPGMVLTDLLLDSAATPAARRVFNALAEEPETVAAALTPRIRGAQGSGGSVDFLTPADSALRMLSRMGEVVGGGRFFDKDGNRVRRAGQAYKDNGVRIQV